MMGENRGTDLTVPTFVAARLRMCVVGLLLGTLYQRRSQQPRTTGGILLPSSSIWWRIFTLPISFFPHSRFLAAEVK